jgi:hypothetical protein
MDTVPGIRRQLATALPAYLSILSLSRHESTAVSLDRSLLLRQWKADLGDS